MADLFLKCLARPNVTWSRSLAADIVILSLVALALYFKYLRPSPLRSLRQKVFDVPCGRAIESKDAPADESPFACMGKVVPAEWLDYRTVEPQRIYKFSPKYFLTMGLQKTDINGITHVDKQYSERLNARKEILHQNPRAVDYLDSAVDMVDELYEFLFQYMLPQRFPTIFRRDDDAGIVRNIVTGVDIPLSLPLDRKEALKVINRNVDEDFLMLLPSPDGDGYSLQSYVWAYPVGFTPQSKMGIKLRDAHRPVPSYKQRLESSMDRYFGKLEAGNIMYRVNWAVATNDKLFEPGEYHLYPGQEPKQTEIDIKNCYVRCERQTLFALPKSGGRVLAVHLYLYPLREIKEEGLGEMMAEAIDGLKKGNAPEVYRYKRAVIWGEQVKEFLRS